MDFQPSADFFGICRLGFKCSWWHSRQANDAVASEQSIFSEIHDYKSFSVSRWTRTCTVGVKKKFPHSIRTTGKKTGGER